MQDLPVIKKLKNGFRAVFIPFKGVDTISFRVLGRAAAVWEEPEELGMAHFMEHMVFNGTEKYPTQEKLSKVVSDVGGANNGTTSFYNVRYMLKLLSVDIERGFDYLSQMVIRPLLNNSDIEKERTIITQELNRRLDYPVSNFMINARECVYPKSHRLSLPIIGTKESLKSLNRNQFLDFHKKYYNSNNFVMSVCGNANQELVFDLAEKYFSNMRKGEKQEFIGFRKNHNLKIYAEENDKIKQATISIIYFAPKDNTKERYAARYLARILGHGDLSRLWAEIRQKRGLAYATNCEHRANTTYGILEIIAQVDPSNVEKVIKLIRKELKKISEKGIKTTEYKRCKKSITASFAFNNESPGKRASIQGSYLLQDREHDNYYTELEKYKETTLEDVNMIAKEIFSHQPKIRVLSNNITDQQVQNAWQS